MPRVSDPPVLIIEMPEAIGFRGQIKSFLTWLRAWPKGGQLVAVLGSGILAGCMPGWPGEPSPGEDARPRQD